MKRLLLQLILASVLFLTAFFMANFAFAELPIPNAPVHGENAVKVLQIATVYDDFDDANINSTLWDIDNPAGIFSQSGGLLNADGPPNLTYADLRSKYIFRGDVEFVLDYRDFQSTATIFTESCPQIWLQVEHSSGNFIYIFRGLCTGGHTFASNGKMNDLSLGGVWSSASSGSGLLKISRTGSTITTYYNEGTGWVAHGTFTGVFTGDVIVQIAVYTGDNGTFHVSSDWITYEGQLIKARWPEVYDSVLGESKENDIKVLRSFRDKVLVKKPDGERYVRQLYRDSFEVALILLLNPELRVLTAEVLEPLLPRIQSVIKGEEMILYETEIEKIKALLDDFAEEATPQLRGLIWQVKRDLDRERFLKQFGIILEK
ncbi:MAG: hypothetical protein NT096_06195 [Proteobacteria bacterium]|nr:hypothetical protein [Pseudomonadota bacterium]